MELVDKAVKGLDEVVKGAEKMLGGSSCGCEVQTGGKKHGAKKHRRGGSSCMTRKHRKGGKKHGGKKYRRGGSSCMTRKHRKGGMKHGAKKHHRGGNVLANAAVPLGLLGLHSFFNTRKGRKELKKTSKTLKRVVKDVKKMEYYQTKLDIVHVDPYVVNNINQEKIGQAIQLFADELKKYLGQKAGYHLLREFRDDLGMDYYSVIKNMGTNLRLKELQDELYGWLNEYERIQTEQ